jgi:hypothetical protein
MTCRNEAEIGMFTPLRECRARRDRALRRLCLYIPGGAPSLPSSPVIVDHPLLGAAKAG